jgi:hypothetical protein
MQSPAAEMSGINYRFADRLISSPLPLPALTVAASVAVPDFRIVSCSFGNELRDDIEWVHSWSDEDGAITMSLARDRDRQDTDHLRLRITDQCDFLICPAIGSLEIEARDGIDNETVEHLLVDQVLPRLVAEGGGLVVHASVVELASGVALFLGKSGWGKSTLASLLHEAGYNVLSDDCAVLRTDAAGSLLAIPTYPGLRLYGDSLENVFRVIPNTIRVASYTSKRRVQLNRKAEGVKSVGVRSIYLLSDPDLEPASDIVIQPAPTAQTCMGIVENSFRLDVRSRAQSTTIFKQAAAISRATPAYTFRYPRDYSYNSAIVRALTIHMDSRSRESL